MMATIMLILSASACILCCYRKCTQNTNSSLNHRANASLVIKNPRPMLMRTSQSSMQNGSNLLMHHQEGYAQIAKNGTEWLVVTHDIDDKESAQTV